MTDLPSFIRSQFSRRLNCYHCVLPSFRFFCCYFNMAVSYNTTETRRMLRKSLHLNKLSLVRRPRFTHLLSKETITDVNAGEPTWETNQLFSEEGQMLLKVFLCQFPSHPYNGGQARRARLVKWSFPLPREVIVWPILWGVSQIKLALYAQRIYYTNARKTKFKKYNFLNNQQYSS